MRRVRIIEQISLDGVIQAPGGAGELVLVSPDTSSSGVLINTYRPVGPLRTGSIADGAE